MAERDCELFRSKLKIEKRRRRRKPNKRIFNVHFLIKDMRYLLAILLDACLSFIYYIPYSEDSRSLSFFITCLNF